MKVTTFVLIILSSCSCNNGRNDHDSVSRETGKRPMVSNKAGVERDITYQLINSPANTFGYRIFSDRKLYIQQSSIPGVPGNKGFATRAAAIKVAELVISKLKSGEIPPTVSTAELKQLNVLE